MLLVQYNKYKTHIINSKIPDGTSTTVYRCGPMIDLCVGPHIPHTGRIKAFSVLKVRVLLIRAASVPMVLIYDWSCRTRLRTFSAAPKTTHCSAFMVSRSPTRRLWWSTRSFWRRLPNAIIAKSAE